MEGVEKHCSSLELTRFFLSFLLLAFFLLFLKIISPPSFLSIRPVSLVQFSSVQFSFNSEWQLCNLTCRSSASQTIMMVSHCDLGGCYEIDVNKELMSVLCSGRLDTSQTPSTAHETCRIRSGSVLDTASYGHYSQRAARIGQDSICRIRFPASVSAPCFKKKEGIDYIAQNRPGSDLDGLVRV